MALLIALAVIFCVAVAIFAFSLAWASGRDSRDQ